jgi:hypothetical protein
MAGVARPFISLGLFLAIASNGLAQRESRPLAAVGGCAVSSSFLLIPIAFVALHIALLVWVARDAKARGMDGAVLWMIT